MRDQHALNRHFGFDLARDDDAQILMRLIDREHVHGVAKRVALGNATARCLDAPIEHPLGAVAAR